MTNNKPIIRAFDIETTPCIAAVWGLYDQRVDPSQLIQKPKLICAAWQDVGSKKVKGVCVDPTDPLDDKEVVLELRAALDEADVLLTHNGARFDIKVFNTRLVELGMEPISPNKPKIDTLKVAKKHFRFPANKLNYLAQQFGVGEKDKMEMQDWLDCMNGNKKALSKMLKYNKKDVSILIDVYNKLLPFIDNHPNLGLWTGGGMVCPNCGSNHIVKQGVKTTRTRTYQQYKCNSCGAWSNDTIHLSKVEIT